VVLIGAVPVEDEEEEEREKEILAGFISSWGMSRLPFRLSGRDERNGRDHFAGLSEIRNKKKKNLRPPRPLAASCHIRSYSVSSFFFVGRR